MKGLTEIIRGTRIDAESIAQFEKAVTFPKPKARKRKTPFHRVPQRDVAEQALRILLSQDVNIYGEYVTNMTEFTTAIIDEIRAKLEVKDYKSSQLYYNLGYYRAAAISFGSLIDNYPDSDKNDEYKLMVIKSYYLYV